MRMHRDSAGVESIPLKLMIVAVVASLSVMPAAHALQALEDRDFVRRAGLCLDMIISVAQTLTTEGPGSVRTISLDLRGEGSLRPDRLTIGDSLGGPNSSSAILRLGNSATIIRSATDPPAVMIGPGRTAFVTSSFELEIRMSAIPGNRTVYLLVEVG